MINKVKDNSVPSLDQAIFQQAIDKIFPKLDEATRKEIFIKVSGHLMEILKDKVFEHDQSELVAFQKAVDDEQDASKQGELYTNTIMHKFFSLSKDIQKRVSHELMEEFQRVMLDLKDAYDEN